VGELTTMAGTAVRLCGGRGWASGGVCRDELRRSASQVADAVSFYMAPPLFSRRNAPGSVIVLASTERYYGGGTYSGSSGGDQCKMQGLSKEVATPPPPFPCNTEAPNAANGVRHRRAAALPRTLGEA